MMHWLVQRSKKLTTLFGSVSIAVTSLSETLGSGGRASMNLGSPALLGSSQNRLLSHMECSTSLRWLQTPQIKRAVQNRRTFGTNPYIVCSASGTPSRELLGLRGVGPVNANLLVAQHITSVNRLQEIFHTTCKKDKQELQRYLADVVGFRNPAHCRSVADHLDDMDWEAAPVRVKLAVEGNIGAGKSTFLDILCDGSLEMQDILEIVPEPVEEWRSVRYGEEEPINLLDRFYKDPKKYAYTFQHYVLLTRMQKDRLARSSSKPLRVLERSIFSDRMVFVRAMHEAGFMGDLELSVYDSWFSMAIAQDRQLTPDGFIYLKARPETCIKRLRTRNRSEEVGVDPAYLENLHDKHESWLHFGARQLNDYVRDARQQHYDDNNYNYNNNESGNLVHTVSSLQHNPGAGLHISPQLAATASDDGRRLRLDRPSLDLLEAAPASIRDSIVFLGNPSSSGSSSMRGGAGGINQFAEEGSIMQALSGVPALVLDHEQEDILYDRDARLDYAKKVREFSEYVNSLRSVHRYGMEVQHAMDSDLRMDDTSMKSGSRRRSGSGNNRKSNSSSNSTSLTADQVDTLKHLLSEYRRFVETQKKQSRAWEGNLSVMEGNLESLTAFGGEFEKGENGLFVSGKDVLRR